MIDTLTDDERRNALPVADRATNAVRVCESKCGTCILGPRSKDLFEPGFVKKFVEETAAKEGHVVCHSFFLEAGHTEGAICRGFADSKHGLRSFALRVGRALKAIVYVPPPDH